MKRKSIRNIIIAFILALFLSPSAVFAYPYGLGTGTGGSIGYGCSGPCYGTNDYGAIVTLYKYEKSTNEVTVVCSYNVPKSFNSMPKIMGKAFSKWAEKAENKKGDETKGGILSAGKNYGVYSVKGKYDYLADLDNKAPSDALNIARFFTKSSWTEEAKSTCTPSSIPVKIPEHPGIAPSAPPAPTDTALCPVTGDATVDAKCNEERQKTIDSKNDTYNTAYDTWSKANQKFAEDMEQYNNDMNIFTPEIEKYWIAIEPKVDLHSKGGNANVKTIRYQCSKSGTNGMTTFQYFLRSIFQTTKMNSTDNSCKMGGTCVGRDVASAMVGTRASTSPFFLIDTSAIKSSEFRCAGTADYKSKNVKQSHNRFPAGLVLKPADTYYLEGKKDGTTYTMSRNVMGIAFYWVPGKDVPGEGDPSCESECGSPPEYGNDTANDNFLTCASKFCEGETENGGEYNLMNPNAKISCITETCGYNPPPMTCDLHDPNDVNNENPYPSNYNDPFKGFTPETNLHQNTECGTVGGSAKNCITSKTMDGVIPNRVYYSMSCVERTDFDFKDLKQKWLIPGELLEYDVILDGNKNCKVYFDYVSWKLDYAAIHSKDPGAGSPTTPNTKRYQMVQHIIKFNNAFVPTVDGSTVGDVAKFKEVLGFDDYDITKVKIDAKFSEIVNTEEATSKPYKLISTGTSDNNTDAISNSDTLSIPLIEGDKIADYMKLNYYNTVSSRRGYYKMPGQCVKEDGTGEVYDAVGDLCFDTTIPYRGYFTHLRATPTIYLKLGQSHHVITGVSVSATKNGNDFYVSDTDICAYNIKYIPVEGGECIISVKSGDKIEGTDHTYNSDIKFELTPVDIPLKDIQSQEMSGDKVTWSSTNEYTVNKPNRCSNTGRTVYGKITKKDGSTVSCEMPVDFIGNCECKLDIISEATSGSTTVYELKNINLHNPTEFYYTVNDGPEIKIEPDVNNNNRYLIKTEGISLPFKINGIIKNADDTVECPVFKEPCPGECFPRCTTTCIPTDGTCINKYCEKYWQIDLTGYASKSECINSCSTGACRTENPTKDPTKAKEYCKNGGFMNDGYTTEAECRADCGEKRCTNLYSADEVMEIKNYCRSYWQEDAAGYQSADDCINHCPSTCSSITTYTYENIVSQCKSNYADWRFDTAESCANTCCIRTGVCSGGIDYLYRPINASNPFPNSYLPPNDPTTPDKERKIGANWFGKDEYITKSEKGLDIVPNSEGNYKYTPVYEIELDVDRIRAIRKDNEAYNKTKAKPGGSVYIDYIRYEEAAGKTATKYESRFIRSTKSDENGGGGFREYFTHIKG